MIKKVKKCLLVMAVSSYIFVGCSEKNSYEEVIAQPTYENIIKKEQLENGDAKFYKDEIITSVNGKLYICSCDAQSERIYDETKVAWLDSLEMEGLIVYGNGDNEIGLLHLDKEDNIIKSQVILKKDNLMIDPTIYKYNGIYYITITDIVGNVNVSDETVENGTYSLKLYSSRDLQSWELLSEIIMEKSNIEDVDFMVVENQFYAIYEKEVRDKKNSGIYLKKSMDNGITWSAEQELLPPDCDHEPACMMEREDGTFELYYSCDKENLGSSYMGAKVYMATYDADMTLKKKDIEIPLVTKESILLYDVRNMDGQKQFLYSRDYLTNSDLFVDAIKTD